MIAFIIISTLEMFFSLILIMLFSIVWLIKRVSTLIVYCVRYIYYGISALFIYLIYLCFERWRLLG